MKEHHKHPPLIKPNRGKYHKNEWAIYGTNCGAIEALFKSLESHCDYKLLYVDADHSDEAKTTQLIYGKKQLSLSQVHAWNEYDDKITDLAVDAAIVNGNHYPAQRQLVVIDPKKKDSLLRRVDQLTQVDMVMVENDASEIFDFVKEKMNSDTQVVLRSEVEQVAKYVSNVIHKSIAPLKAVILAGGKSQRMHSDKSQIVYHDELSQQEYMAQLCSKLGIETYISKAHDFSDNHIGDHAVIKDRLVAMGPFGAVLSAMISDPNAAWLVLACDLPYLDSVAISNLIENRDASKYATAYQLKAQPFPEPLLAIYEPRIYQRMLRFLSLGYACPRKVLINSDIEKVELLDELIAFNANTPEERDQVINEINA